MLCNAITNNFTPCKCKGILFNTRDKQKYCRTHYKTSNDIGVKCSVCLDRILYKNNWKITKCGHHFHKMCWYDLTKKHKVTQCPICRRDMCSQIPEIYYHIIFYITLFSKSGNNNNNNLITMSYDPLMLFGKNGSFRIKKRHFRKRPLFIFNTFVNHFKAVDFINNKTNDDENSTNNKNIIEHIGTIASNYLIKFTFGSFSTDFYLFNSLPLFLQYYLTKDAPSLITILNTIQFLLKYVFFKQFEKNIII